MPRMQLKNVRLAFDAIYAPKAFGDGDPAYGGKFIVPPDHPQVQELRDAMLTAAKDKWGEKGEGVLKLLKEDKKVCFIEGEYRNKKTGEPYDGFAGNFYLSARNGGENPVKPSAFAADNSPAGADSGLIYGGMYVDASVDIYAQDNQYGRRINCSLRGVRWAGKGDSFGGGAPASADEFGAPVSGDASDFV